MSTAPEAILVVPPLPAGEVALLRVCAAGARGIDVATLRRDVSAALSLPASGPRRFAAAHWVRDATAAGHVNGVGASNGTTRLRRGTRAGDNTTICDAGAVHLKNRFGGSALRNDWSTLTRQHLVGHALGLPANAGAQRLKRLATADGLRAAIVRNAWQLGVPENATVAVIRDALAMRALSEALGNHVTRQLGRSSGLSGKAARVIAGELLGRARRFGSDAGLLGALAAAATGAADGSPTALRQALLTSLGRTGAGQTALQTGVRLGEIASAATSPQGKKDNSRVTTATPQTSPVPHPCPPAKACILEAVRLFAKRHASGWSGNRRAYISHVWQAVCDSYPEWGLSEDQFKSLLAEAHREGTIVLVNADLRDRQMMPDVQASAVRYQNMEWHFVRVLE